MFPGGACLMPVVGFLDYSTEPGAATHETLAGLGEPCRG